MSAVRASRMRGVPGIASSYLGSFRPTRWGERVRDFHTRVSRPVLDRSGADVGARWARDVKIPVPGINILKPRR
jgi:hypothetical protein